MVLVSKEVQRTVLVLKENNDIVEEEHCQLEVLVIQSLPMDRPYAQYLSKFALIQN